MLQAVLLLYTLRTAEISARNPMGSGGWRHRDFAAMASTIPAQAGPVTLVSGPYGVAGMLARQLPGQPRVLIDGQLARSPWLGATDLAQLDHILAGLDLRLSEDALQRIAQFHRDHPMPY